MVPLYLQSGKGVTLMGRPVPSAGRPPRTAVARVLVVDDSQIARKVIRQALEQGGHDVAEAGAGEQGLEAALERRPDCTKRSRS